MYNILVVEDDSELNRSFCFYLSKNGFAVEGFTDARLAEVSFFNKKYDMIISDIMMPVEDGYTFAENIRSFDKTVPIIFVSARDDYFSKEKGYTAGIDDYMVKPIDLDELKLRINALLKRANIARSQRIEINDFVIDAQGYFASYKDIDLNLTAREFKILFKLLSNPEITITRNSIMNDFWNHDTEVSDRNVDVCLSKLRNKVSICPYFSIVTIRGLGYKATMKR